MRVRIADNDDLCPLIRFLILNDYPHDWHYETLKDCCVLRLEHGGRVVGYFWMHWRSDMDRVSEIHVCVERKYHGRWMLRSVVSDIFKLCELMRANALLANAQEADLASALQRIGFVPGDGGLYKHFKQ